MKTLAILATFAVVALSGCLTPTKSQVENADAGPFPTGYIKIIKESVKYTMKDPGSVEIQEIEYPKKSFNHRDRVYCWCVAVWMNAKNSYGGYTGVRPYLYYIRDGQLFDYKAVR